VVRATAKAAQQAAAELQKPAAKQATSAKGKAAAKPVAATSAAVGKSAKAASSVVKPSPNVLTDGGGVQHRLGQVSDRSACNIKACRNPNAVLGCQTCGIHLCSPECYNAHALNGAVQGGKACAVFMDVSKLSQRLSNPNKGRHKD
jgi:hypothetical protein